ncbi:NIPSNAP family protein [Delftia lacustris]|uniref:NIPSNAP protein n=2 Tax=Delftia TaxID=80865 RepID=A0A1H3HYR9_9BURK|nr:NIPSNAP family protein [Delftia lacustris]SDY20640.1 NIPSNAP protein [Delftia lacustris]
MVGYYTSDSGPLNQIVHLWAYTDLNERAERRARLLAEPRWQAYVARMLPLLQSQESKLLVPAPFFQPQWSGCQEPLHGATGPASTSGPFSTD